MKRRLRSALMLLVLAGLLQVGLALAADSGKGRPQAAPAGQADTPPAPEAFPPHPDDPVSEAPGYLAPAPSDPAGDGALTPGRANRPFLTLAELGNYRVYVPFMVQPEPVMTELRALWVTRFDWTSYGQPANPAKIDEIVQNASLAGFNVIYFQVRGTADAYYAPGLEPWAQRVSGGVLGQAPNPYWDPLAYFVNAAHNAGIELHAYINVYPVWDCGSTPPTTNPLHFYHRLQNIHGVSLGRNKGLIWDTNYNVQCSGYVRATPASVPADDHYVAIGQDLVNRYAIDGIHLDHIRYGGRSTSCDPVTESRYGAACFAFTGFRDWQRAQVNGTVHRFYQDVILPSQGQWLSAAVWPIYIDYWGWGASQGYHDYYQDSKAWLAGGYIDSISPMIYPSTFNCPDDSFWTFGRWQTLVTDFLTAANGRYVIPGIGAGYCTFGEINNRIQAARTLGAPGHAIFSYGGLRDRAYFDDLRAGPYRVRAVVPPVTWHP